MTKTIVMKELEDIISNLNRENYFIDDKLNKNKVIEELYSYDSKLISALIENELISKHFVEDMNGNKVIKLTELIDIFESDSYWKDSYTSYVNKVGLTSGGKYIDESTDVVLDFPYKDAVLKGGMTKEDVKSHNESYYHEHMAIEEIDKLFDNKILVNARRHDESGTEDIDKFNEDDNLIIKGNNLLVLNSIKEKYAGKVKLIYLDPPYFFEDKKKEDAFAYNSNFKLSTWLTFMKNRLEIAKELLSDDGVIFVHISGIGEAYLKILMDELFSKDSYINSISVLSSTPSGLKTAHRDKTIIKTKDQILVYKKSEIKIKPQYTEVEEWDSHFNLYLDKDKNIVMSLKDVLHENKIYDKKVAIKNYSLSDSAFFDFVYANADNIFQTGKSMPESVREISLKPENKDLPVKYESSNGTQYAYNGRRMSFLSNSMNEVLLGNTLEKRISKLVCDFWDDIDFNNSQNEGGVSFPSGKKPEKLLYRIIDMVTEKGDIVLDFFLGSGTTAAVAHKMGRQYIGIEQLDYGENDSVTRLDKVVSGEQSGISKSVNWQGGGSFVYAELMEKSKEYITLIQNAISDEQLNEVLDMMYENVELDFRADLAKLQEVIASKESSLSNKKELMLRVIDKNQLYCNYSEIDDTTIRDFVSDSDYNFNKSFYGGNVNG